MVLPDLIVHLDWFKQASKNLSYSCDFLPEGRPFRGRKLKGFQYMFLRAHRHIAWQGRVGWCADPGKLEFSDDVLGLPLEADGAFAPVAPAFPLLQVLP